MVRFGLCSTFREQPIKYRAMSALQLKNMKQPFDFLGECIADNLFSLKMAIKFCVNTRIGSYRIPTGFFPMYTHPDFGYRLEQLPNFEEIVQSLGKLKTYAKDNNLRITMHPDEYVVLNSPRQDVLKNSIREIEYHMEVCEYLGGDVITIHGGGAYGDKKHALQLLFKNFAQVPKKVLKFLTIKNDDKNFTPTDLLPLCKEFGIPLVLDAHHFRCNPDETNLQEAAKIALKTWDREPVFHISSPQEGWRAGLKVWRHHDYVNPEDFPQEWLKIKKLTIDVEANAQELAVLELMRKLGI
jgi:UV DNA damage endonuclease